MVTGADTPTTSKCGSPKAIEVIVNVAAGHRRRGPGPADRHGHARTARIVRGHRCRTDGSGPPGSGQTPVETRHSS
jgi:hypothetical protein